MKIHVFVLTGKQETLLRLVEAMNETGLSYKCTWAKDMAQAISQLQYLQPDLLIADDLYGALIDEVADRESFTTALLKTGKEDLHQAKTTYHVPHLDLTAVTAVLAKHLMTLMWLAINPQLAVH